MLSHLCGLLVCLLSVLGTYTVSKTRWADQPRPSLYNCYYTKRLGQSQLEHHVTKSYVTTNCFDSKILIKKLFLLLCLLILQGGYAYSYGISPTSIRTKMFASLFQQACCALLGAVHKLPPSISLQNNQNNYVLYATSYSTTNTTLTQELDI